MNSNLLIQKIYLRLGKFKWLIVAVGIVFAGIVFFYARTIKPVYTTKATVFPLNASIENPNSSAIATLLGGSDGTKSFSADASINIVELALSRNTMDAVVLKRLPQFNNKRIGELLIESYNNSLGLLGKPLIMPTDTAEIKALGGALLRDIYTAKILKSGILEMSFSNTNKNLLSPVSYALIDKVSQFYIDLKIKKAKSDYDFISKKVDSLQQILDIYDKRAIQMNNTTLFVPNSKIEFSIPKENLISAKERVMRQRDASANNMENALWRLQKATPIIATLDKPEAPYIVQQPSSYLYAILGFIFGSIIITMLLITPYIINYTKAETKKAVFGNDEPVIEKQ